MSSKKQQQQTNDYGFKTICGDYKHTGLVTI